METPEDEDAALETLERALAAIRRDPERNEATERVIEAMEDTRAQLIAAKLRRTARERLSGEADSARRLRER